MGLLKVAVIAGVTDTPVAPAAGVVEVTAGRTASETYAVSWPHPMAVSVKAETSNINNNDLRTRIIPLHVGEPTAPGGVAYDGCLLISDGTVMQHGKQ